MNILEVRHKVQHGSIESALYAAQRAEVRRLAVSLAEPAVLATRDAQLVRALRPTDYATARAAARAIMAEVFARHPAAETLVRAFDRVDALARIHQRAQYNRAANVAAGSISNQPWAALFFAARAVENACRPSAGIDLPALARDARNAVACSAALRAVDGAKAFARAYSDHYWQTQRDILRRWVQDVN